MGLEVEWVRKCRFHRVTFDRKSDVVSQVGLRMSEANNVFASLFYRSAKELSNSINSRSFHTHNTKSCTKLSVRNGLAFFSVWFSLHLTDEARSKQCGILVHCLAGISRSVTVTVAYLMQRLNLSLNDAYDFVKRKKSNISPNFNFMGQLLDFERTLGLHSPCDNRSTSKEQLFFTTPTNHNVFQLDTLESTWE